MSKAAAEAALDDIASDAKRARIASRLGDEEVAKLRKFMASVGIIEGDGEDDDAPEAA